MAKQHYQFKNPITPSVSSEEPGTEAQDAGIKSKMIEKKREKPFYNFKLIPRNKIRPNKKNTYDKEKLPQIKDSILNYGLFQNLLVIYIMSEDMFVLEAGATRLQAIDELMAEFSEESDAENERYQLYLQNVKGFEKGIPCKISDTLSDETEYDLADEDDLSSVPEAVIDSEIRLIRSNEDTREPNPAIQAKNVARLGQLYRAKNKGKKWDERINVNEKIAEDLGITRRQVVNYNSLSSLIPELQEEFNKCNIPLKKGVEYAKLSEAEQRTILLLIKNGQQVSVEEVKTLAKEKQELAAKIDSKEAELASLRKKLEANENTGQEEREKEIESLKKELESIKKIHLESAASSRELLDYTKASITIRTTIEQLTACINTFNKTADSYTSLISKMTEQPDSIIDIENARETLRNLI